MAEQALPKMATAGKPEKATIIGAPQIPVAENVAAAAVLTPPATEKPEDTKPEVPSVSDEQVRAFFETKGIAFDGNYDALKEKINYIPPANEPSAEQKALKEQQFEKRMLDFYTANGGKVEDYVALKQVASADLTELSKSELVREMKAEGFDDKEIELVIKERYYQMEESDLEQFEDGSEKAFAKRKKEYGAKKLANRSSYLKTQAENILSNLKQAVTSEDLQKQEEEKFSSKVDEYFKTLPRKMTFQLGQVDNADIPPVEYKVFDTDINEVAGMLKDSVRRQQFFFNTDNSLNLPNIAEVMLRNKILETAVKSALLEGQTRQVAEYDKTFGGTSPHEIGVGGAPGKQSGQKGKFVTAGKSQLAVRQT